MKIKIQLQHPNAKAPTYATDGSACFDLYAATVSNSDSHTGDIVYAGHPVICDTGLAFEVPFGYMLKIEPRSGLKFKHGIEAFSGTGDSDYRGSLLVYLESNSNAEHEPAVRIKPGDRIAQACLVPVPRCEFELVEQLTITERGAGGFGHTGR